MEQHSLYVWRTPANLAMTALNMDKMSEGRFFLGLGASGKAVIEGFHGEKFEKPLSRMRVYQHNQTSYE